MRDHRFEPPTGRRHVQHLVSLAIVLPALGATSSARAATPAITLAVDATEAPRKVFHARLVIPAAPGPLTLRYPKWIPGEHGPSGPINGLAGLRFSAGGKPLPWRRDPMDMYAFHLDVPAGAGAVEAALDFLAPVATEGFSAGASTSEHLAVLSWNQVLLYPEGAPADEIAYQASVRLPAAWKFATALPVAKQAGAAVDFRPVSLTTLIDSPVLTGAYLRSFPLTAAGRPPMSIEVAADSAGALQAPAQLVESWRRMAAEAHALFDAAHYRSYRFLFTLSDQVAHFGLEHHESSDNRLSERTLIDDDPRMLGAGLLPHELVHSWNGKYRRPADVATPSYHQPMKTELLWVYEGLTTYLGQVLTARSGLLTAEQAREELALTAAAMDHVAGRTWRPLVDTAVAAQIVFGAPQQWASWRRRQDFYPEMQLIWLEADTIIRRQTQGQKSLDDFCRLFFGPPSGPPAVKTYTFDDVVGALGEVARNDWRAFFKSRVYETTARAPLGGIEAAGWRLAYREAPPRRVIASEKARREIDLTFSLGMLLKEEGTVVDVVPGLPAAAAGVAPGMKLVAVNSRRYRPQLLRDAVAATKATPDLELLLDSGEVFRTARVKYRGGARYPHLERDPRRPDLLGDVLRPAAMGSAVATSPAR